jgi:hypothetical protein
LSSELFGRSGHWAASGCELAPHRAYPPVGCFLSLPCPAPPWRQDTPGRAGRRGPERWDPEDCFAMRYRRGALRRQFGGGEGRAGEGRGGFEGGVSARSEDGLRAGRDDDPSAVHVKGCHLLFSPSADSAELTRPGRHAGEQRIPRHDGPVSLQDHHHRTRKYSLPT